MKKLVTEKDVETGANNGEFLVNAQMILTPSAKDYALRHGIALVYPEQSSESSNESAMDVAIREAVVAEFGRADRTIINAVRDGLTSEADAPKRATGEPHIKAIRSEGSRNRVVLSAIGANQVGVLGHFTKIISGMGCDIENVSQTIVGGYFTMILIVEIDSLQARGVTFDKFRDALMTEADKLGVQAMVMHEEILNAMHRV